MRPETLQGEFVKLLAHAGHAIVPDEDREVSLTDAEMFELWNMLGEELGIDLSLATEKERKLLFEACQNGRKIRPKDFGSLLWLVYYGDERYQ